MLPQLRIWVQNIYPNLFLEYQVFDFYHRIHYIHFLSDDYKETPHILFFTSKGQSKII